MYFARISAGLVAEIVQATDRQALAELYHPDLVANMVECSAEVAAGWLYDGEDFSAPEQPGVDLVAYAADVRWRIETGGITIAGVPIATDDRSKLMIMGARLAAAASPDWETLWHGSDGGTYPLNAADMIAISDEVQAHVNATFATFAAVKADIAAGTITNTTEIDAAFG